ncbi:MAG: Na+/H+ antiporter NhaA, partial [Mariprofundaceae bacterium]|nr:Na+/H+ antiporter NhaA [Mariprofundaceae bacterium]
KPLLLWINDGLMAIFFFLVGLELKRELLAGELADVRTATLPAMGAIGGMAVPVGIYVWFNAGDMLALNGWAIPTATDIAFALGILALLGPRVPVALKIFLAALAIFDDLGAIIIIAAFYTSSLSTAALLVASGCIGALLLINRLGVTRMLPYLAIGLVMWVAVLKSGIHATLAGVLLAMFIPMHGNGQHSPLRKLEHRLHKPVAFIVLPMFAFANAGIDIRGMGIDYLLHPVPLGITLGLVLGKPIGVLAFTWLGVKSGLARLPHQVDWRQLFGISMLCGVGFTMSLFIGSLAFEANIAMPLFDERLGIMAGSAIAGIAGYAYLRRVLPEISSRS